MDTGGFQSPSRAVERFDAIRSEKVRFFHGPSRYIGMRFEDATPTVAFSNQAEASCAPDRNSRPDDCLDEQGISAIAAQSTAILPIAVFAW